MQHVGPLLSVGDTEASFRCGSHSAGCDARGWVCRCRGQRCPKAGLHRVPHTLCPSTWAGVLAPATVQAALYPHQARAAPASPLKVGTTGGLTRQMPWPWGPQGQTNRGHAAGMKGLRGQGDGWRTPWGLEGLLVGRLQVLGSRSRGRVGAWGAYWVTGLHSSHQWCVSQHGQRAGRVWLQSGAPGSEQPVLLPGPSRYTPAPPLPPLGSQRC